MLIRHRNAEPFVDPTAWVALGRALLTTDLLGGCGLRARYGATASSGDWP